MEAQRRVDDDRALIEKRLPRARDQDEAVDLTVDERELGRHVDLREQFGGVEARILSALLQEGEQRLEIDGVAGDSRHHFRDGVRPGTV